MNVTCKSLKKMLKLKIDESFGIALFSCFIILKVPWSLERFSTLFACQNEVFLWMMKMADFKHGKWCIILGFVEVIWLSNCTCYCSLMCHVKENGIEQNCVSALDNVIVSHGKRRRHWIADAYGRKYTDSFLLDTLFWTVSKN